MKKSIAVLLGGLAVLPLQAFSKGEVKGLGSAIEIVERETRLPAVSAERLSVEGWEGFLVRVAGRDGRSQDYYVLGKTGEASAIPPPSLAAKDRAGDVAPQAATVPQAPAPTWESFEGPISWTVQDWGDSAKVEVVTDPVSHGDKALDVTVAKGKAGKVALGIETLLDLSPCASFVLDAFNGVKGGALSVAFCTGENYAYFETVPTPLALGWNREIRFDLQASLFKSQETNWTFTAPLSGKGDVRKILILIYGSPKEEAKVVLDQLRFTRE